MEVTRIFDLLDWLKEKYNKEDILCSKHDGEWIKYSVDDYYDNSHNIAYGLMAMGLKKGDKIATISNNRPEWNFIDMGLAMCGIVHVPIYPTISADDYRYIFNHSEPKYIIVSDKQLYSKIKNIAEKFDFIKGIYTFNIVEGEKNWTEIYDIGKENKDRFKDELIKIKASIKADDLFTILYTSGTTGNPKGVMLSHNNLISNFKAHINIHSCGSEAKSISFLPISHIFERCINYHYQYKGISIYYAENLGTIVENMKEIKPDLFVTVPRVLEKAYDKIITIGKDLPFFKRQVFFASVSLANKFKLEGNNFIYRFLLKIADRLVFVKWREAFGGNVKVVVSGGAALQPRLARILWAAGIHVAEGYGLTETSPVISASNFVTNEVKFGTVGPIMPNLDVKLSEEGEILCKGPSVMLGYYKAPELTSEVIDNEGYFHTGDIGTFVDGKYLKITDRKKEIFKLNSGKYIAPQAIENKLKESFFIEQAMVVGENQKFASAIISPNFSFLHDWCAKYKIHYRDNDELITIPEVIARYQKEVNAINATLGQTEHIKRFRLVSEEWGPQTGELSPTLKLKRNVLMKRYAHIIKEIYEPPKKNKGFIPIIKNGIKIGVDNIKNIKLPKI